MSIDSLSSAELQKLEIPQIGDGAPVGMISVEPQKATPVSTPTPEVVAKALEIAAGPVKAASLPELDDETKTAFLAHVLTAKPFKKHYVMLGGKLVMTFGTMTAKTYQLLLAQALEDERWKPTRFNESNRKLRMQVYESLASLVSLKINDSEMVVGTLCPQAAEMIGDMHRALVEGFLAKISQPSFQLIRDRYVDFVGTLDVLMQKSTDASFWATPS